MHTVSWNMHDPSRPRLSATSYAVQPDSYNLPCVWGCLGPLSYDMSLDQVSCSAYFAERPIQCLCCVSMLQYCDCQCSLEVFWQKVCITCLPSRVRIMFLHSTTVNYYVFTTNLGTQRLPTIHLQNANIVRWTYNQRFHHLAPFPKIFWKWGKATKGYYISLLHHVWIKGWWMHTTLYTPTLVVYTFVSEACDARSLKFKNVVYSEHSDPVRNYIQSPLQSVGHSWPCSMPAHTRWRRNSVTDSINWCMCFWQGLTVDICSKRQNMTSLPIIYHLAPSLKTIIMGVYSSRRSHFFTQQGNPFWRGS